MPSIVYGILGLAFLVRGIGLGRVAARRRAHPHAARAADGDHRRARGDAGRADSIREGAFALGATKWQVVSRQVLPAAIPGIATGSILGALARDRRDRAAAPDRRAHVHRASTRPSLGAFTALPDPDLQLDRAPQDEFKALAAAAIIVLLVMLLALNAVAIWLRNRYQKRW